MTYPIYRKTVFFLTLAGFLFSGYLSAVRFFTKTCALSESCPYVWGYPACYYGFILFLLMLIASANALVKPAETKTTAHINAIFSSLGILFAGWLTLSELGNLFAGETSYTLGLPTCAYGLIFFILIFIISLRTRFSSEPNSLKF